MKSLIHDLMNKLAIIKGQRTRKISDEDKLEKIYNVVDLIVEICRKRLKESNENKCITNEVAGEYAMAWVHSMEVIHNTKIEIGKFDLNPDDKVYNHNSVMDSVFTNALENAINAGATEFKLEGKRTEFYTEYSLSDNGPGMSEDVINNLGFGYTKGGNGQGTMWIRKKLASVDAVPVWESSNGNGTIFRVRCKNGPATKTEELKNVA